MNSPSLVYVLVEDQRQKQFIYRFLSVAGLNSHQMTIEVSPSGRGSAEGWVRENFPRQVGKCRARNARASTGMFVLIDADAKTVQERLDALDQALVNAGQIPIDRKVDPIARLIPKRNVETWIFFLSLEGIAVPLVDEVQDYKHNKKTEQWSALIPAAATTLYAWTKSSAKLPVNLIDSLRQGIDEIPYALPARQ
jgi:hypothetical protein